MNENFKQLAIQSKLTLITTHDGKPVGITEQQLEVYSKMIVQECARIVASDPFYASFAAKEIKDHFGVK